MPRIHLKPVANKFTIERFRELSEKRRLPSCFLEGYLMPREYRVSAALKDLGYTVSHCHSADAHGAMKMAKNAEKSGYQFVVLFNPEEKAVHPMFSALIARSPLAVAPRSKVVVNDLSEKSREAIKTIQKRIASKVNIFVATLKETPTGFEVHGFSDEISRVLNTLFNLSLPFSVTHD